MKACVACIVCKVVSLSQEFPAHLPISFILLGVVPLVAQREVTH